MDKPIKIYKSKLKKKNNKYGILGGTFDPVHIGHLFLAQAALTELELDRVIFIPTGTAPHKDNISISDSIDRLIMTSMAIMNNKNFEVSSIEVNREGPSYTVDTIGQLKEHHEEGTEFYFITGSDALLEFETWKNYERLFSLIKIVVTTRPGYNDESLNKKIKFFEEKYKGDIIKIFIPMLEISSTEIRKRVKEGKTIKYLVTDSVEHYILKNKLYEQA